MPKFKLSKERKSWVGKRDTTLNGLKLTYNASQQQKYVRALRLLVKQMTIETKRAILKLFKSGVSKDYFEKQEELAAMDESLNAKAKKVINKLTERFTKLFNDSAREFAEKMLKGASKTSETTLNASLKQLSGGLSLKTSIVPEGMKEVSQSIINENVSLIKSIPQEYLTDISGAVMRSITTGNGLQDLVPALKRYEGVTDRRAKNIALDQTRKAYNSINKQRLLALGVKKFKWIHSGGGQTPRQDHIEMNGNIYSFDDPPIVDKRTGQRGIPGDAINCRCTMSPVIEFEDGEQ